MSIESIDLSCREGFHDKVYRAQIEEAGNGYVVNYQFGRRGTELSSGTKTDTPVSLAEATSVFDKLAKQKLGKGYFREVECANKNTAMVAGQALTQDSVNAALRWLWERAEHLKTRDNALAFVEMLHWRDLAIKEFFAQGYALQPLISGSEVHTHYSTSRNESAVRWLEKLAFASDKAENPATLLAMLNWRDKTLVERGIELTG